MPPRGLQRIEARADEQRDRLPCIRYPTSGFQEFRENPLPLPNPGVTLPVSYDRNAPAKPPSRLCPRQHLRADTRRPTRPATRRGLRQDLPREGNGRAQRPPRASQDARPPRARRRGNGDTHSPLGAQHRRPVRHRQADRGRRGAVSILGRAVGRHWHQHRALDDCRSRRLADVERDLIRPRTAEGRSRAKAQGKHVGRLPSLTPEQQKEAAKRRAQGATLQELAKSYDVSRATISRLAPINAYSGKGG